MGIVLQTATNMYICDSNTTGSLFTTPQVLERIIYMPNTAGDNLVFKDKENGTDMIILKAGASDASPIHLPFGDSGKHVPGMWLQSITSGGTVYVYLK